MHVRNTSTKDIIFMFKSEKGNEEMPVFETVNIIPGWSVIIADEIWEKIKTQKITIREMVTEEQEIKGVTMTGMDGEKYTPTKLIKQATGKTKEVSLIGHLVKTRQLEQVVDETPVVPEMTTDKKIALLNRFGVEATKEDGEEVISQKMKQMVEDMELLKSFGG